MLGTSPDLIRCRDAVHPGAAAARHRVCESGDFGALALATNLELAKIAPTNEGALTRLSRCYMEGGQLDEATATLDAALQLNPQNTIARSLQLEVTKRRVASTPVIKTPRTRAPSAARSASSSGLAVRPRTSRGGARSPASDGPSSRRWDLRAGSRGRVAGIAHSSRC